MHVEKSVYNRWFGWLQTGQDSGTIFSTWLLRLIRTAEKLCLNVLHLAYSFICIYFELVTVHCSQDMHGFTLEFHATTLTCHEENDFPYLGFCDRASWANCEERDRKPTRCNNQMFIINTVSTCFGHHYAHIQENKDRVLLHVVCCAGCAGCGW